MSGSTVSIRLAPTAQRQFGLPEGPSGTTDADGAFAIGNLLPGRYIVSVSARPRTGVPLSSSSRERQKTYVTTYYPDATDPTDATAVELGAGAELRGLEIRLQRLPVFKVSGKVVNGTTGEAFSAETLSLIRQGAEAPGLSARSTGVSAAGEFSFDGIVPGNYILETKLTAEAGAHQPLAGWQTISVGNQDLDRVVVEMKPAIEMTGRIIVEGAPASSWPQITLTPVEGLNYLDSPMIDADGHFRLAGLEPALYRVTIGSLPRPLFIKSVRFNGRDISGGPIDLGSSATASLEIVMCYGSSTITGLVSDSQGPVGPTISVMAIRRNLSTYAATQTDESGRFSLKGLPAGEYFLAAVDMGPGRLLPEIVEKVGKTITVDDGSSASLDLQLTTTDDLRAANLR